MNIKLFNDLVTVAANWQFYRRNFLVTKIENIELNTVPRKSNFKIVVTKNQRQHLFQLLPAEMNHVVQ